MVLFPALQVLDGSEEQFGVVHTVNEAWFAIDHRLSCQPWAVSDELNTSDRFALLSACRFGDLSRLKSLPAPQGPAHSLLKGKYFAKALA